MIALAAPDIHFPIARRFWRHLATAFSSSVSKQAPHHFFPRRTKVMRDLANNGAQGADPQGRMVRDGHVMLSVLIRCESDMAARLARGLITKFGESFDQLGRRDVPRSLKRR
jgi:hypothetical protein